MATCTSDTQAEKELDNVVDESARDTEEITINTVQEDSQLSNLKETEEAVCDSSENIVCIVNKDDDQNISRENNGMQNSETLNLNINTDDKSSLLEDDARKFPNASENVTCDIAATEKDKNASEDYTFNLDDLSTEELDCSNEEDRLNALLNKYSNKNKEDEERQSDSLINEIQVGKRLSMLQLCKENITDKPKLSGAPDDLIDLTDSPKQSAGVTDLIERFMKHACPQNIVKDKIKVE